MHATPRCFTAGPQNSTSTPFFREALWVWIKIGLFSFDGPPGQIALMHHELVERLRWLSEAQMMEGLGLAETTPGPLILVLQFVGFLGGWQEPGELPPLLAATAGAALTSRVAFVPGGGLLGLAWRMAG